MKKIIIVILFLLFNSCSQIDFENSNKRSFDIIEKEKQDIKGWNAVFETDTLLNFKTVKEIKSIFGEPTKERKVAYLYPSMNILWILEGPLNGAKSYSPVLMLEWHDLKKELLRVILFVKKDSEWISLCNILYSDGIQY